MMPSSTKAFEAVRQFRAVCSLVGELTHQQPKRLGVTGNPQRPRVHWLKSNVTDESGGDFFAARIVAAVDETGPMRFAPRLIDAEKHLAWHGIEHTDNLRLRNFLRKLLGPRGGVPDHEAGIAGIHRQ